MIFDANINIIECSSFIHFTFNMEFSGFYRYTIMLSTMVCLFLMFVDLIFKILCNTLAISFNTI